MTSTVPLNSYVSIWHANIDEHFSLFYDPYVKEQSNSTMPPLLCIAMRCQKCPLGIKDALIGRKKGERRRVELGFETPNWQPEPVSKRGKDGWVQKNESWMEMVQISPRFQPLLYGM